MCDRRENIIYRNKLLMINFSNITNCTLDIFRFIIIDFINHILLIFGLLSKLPHSFLIFYYISIVVMASGDEL